MMDGLLSQIFSASDSLKRKAKGLLSDPAGYIEQVGGLLSDDRKTTAERQARMIHSPESITQEDVAAAMNTATGFAPLGMTAWHGSPHKFDKFDMSKIGTGEGAQAYGHGLYMAELPEVASGYKQSSSLGKGKFEIDGTDALTAAKKDSSIEKAVRYLQDYGDAKLAKQYAKEYGDVSAAAKIEDLEKTGRLVTNPPPPEGSMYKVDIPDEAVARFLDWDKPLSQQAPEVQKSLRSAFDSMYGNAKYGEKNFNQAQGMTGGELVNFFRNRESASQAMNAAGVPGIRYLDGGSRGYHVDLMLKDKLYASNKFDTLQQAEQYAADKAAEGFMPKIDMRGTSNFVAFDPEMIRILERNGQATGLNPWQPGEWGGLLK